MASTIFLLISLVALGHFTDFIIGQSGRRKVKDRLADVYVAVAEGDWSTLFRSPAQLFLRYIEKVFSFKSVPVLLRRVILYSVGISLLVDGALLVSSIAVYPNVLVIPLSPSGVSPFHPPFLLASAATNLVFDLWSLLVVKRCMKSIEVVKARYLIPLLAMFVCVTFVICVIACMFQTGLSVVVYSRTYHILPSLNEDLHAAYLAALTLPAVLKNNPQQLYSLLPCIQIILPMTTYIIFCALAYTVYLLRNVLRKPLLIVLERLDEARSGVFTSIAAAISALVGLFEALIKWIGTSG
jgi:hypothetical protein